MGAGRRTHTAQVDTSSIEQKVMKRGLRKEELGGVIFHCNNDTMGECISRNLFGLPRAHYEYVKNIEEGMPLFLFNIDGRKLYGIFKATASGTACFNRHPDAWSVKGCKMSRYPAQVTVVLERQCQPLEEAAFGKVISSSYYARGRFMNEINKQEAQSLLGLFGSVPVSRPPISGSTSASSSAGVGPPRLGYVKPVTAWKQVTPAPVSVSVSASASIEEFGEVTYAGKVRGFEDEMKHHVASNVAEVVLEVPEMVPEVKPRTVAEVEHAMFGAREDERFVFQELPDGPRTKKRWGDDDPEAEYQFRALLENLTVKEPETVVGAVQESDYISDDVVALREEVKQLRAKPVDESEHAIYVIGGYGSNSDRLTSVQKLRINAVGSVMVKSVAPLLAPRSCAASVGLNGEIYVLGGVIGGQEWYKSVEKFHPWLNSWSACADMNIARGMLAAVAIEDRIYAIGGRNFNTFYSDVEWYEANLGAWLPSTQMLQPRGSMAAVTLDGAIYIIGGTNGEEYLSSVERLDPRACRWSKVSEMASKRVWLSAAVAGGKIYAVGGCDRNRYLNSVECYDPRADRWEFVASLREPRAHLCAAALDGEIYALNGLDRQHTYFETVERYSPSLRNSGWSSIHLPELKSRSLMSVAVL